MELLTKIKLLHHQCEEHKYGDCNHCAYHMEGYKCKIKEICYLLARSPWDWDIEEIERIWNA